MQAKGKYYYDLSIKHTWQMRYQWWGNYAAGESMVHAVLVSDKDVTAWHIGFLYVFGLLFLLDKTIIRWIFVNAPCKYSIWMF